MKKTLRLLCLVLVLATALMLFTLVGSADSACELNGQGYSNINDALSVASEGDIITLHADVTEPVRVEKAVTVVAGDYSFTWYSSAFAPAVADGTYTFAASLDVGYVDWFVGYRTSSPERLTYTLGSSIVYYGTQVWGDYTLGDNDLKFTGLIDAEGNSVTPDTMTDLTVIPSYYCKYESLVPKFKVVAPDGTETVYNVSTDLRSAASDAPDGATIVLLDDIFFPYYAETSLTRAINITVTDGKLLNFDFAGHSLISETKIVMFTTDGSCTKEIDGETVTVGSSLNVYSSLPGATLFLGQKNTNSAGGAIMNANDGTTINFGEYAEYSGRNISAYAACCANVYTGAVCTIKGASIYRMMNDWVGFLYLRTNYATLNLIDARIFAVQRDIQIAFGNKNVVTGSKLYAKNTLFATLAIADSEYSGNFIRYISDGCEAIFESCSFDTIPFRVEKYTTSDTQPKVKVFIDDDCSFNKLPISYNSEVFTFEQITREQTTPSTPKLIYTNDITTDPILFGSFNSGAAHDYNLTEYEKRVGGFLKFVSSDYLERAAEITWYFGEKSTAEWWELGATPYPFSMSIPSDTDFVRYYVSDTTPVAEGMSYDIVGERLFNVKFNLTLSSKLKVNVYIPYLKDTPLTKYLDRVTVGAMTTTAAYIMENLKPITVEDKQYYKVTFEYDYAKVPENIRIILGIVGTGTNADVFSEANIVNTAKYARHFLEGDFDESLKANIKGMLYMIKDSYLNQDKNPPETIVALIDEKFPRA